MYPAGRRPAAGRWKATSRRTRARGDTTHSNCKRNLLAKTRQHELPEGVGLARARAGPSCFTYRDRAGPGSERRRGGGDTDRAVERNDRAAHVCGGRICCGCPDSDADARGELVAYVAERVERERCRAVVRGVLAVADRDAVRRAGGGKEGLERRRRARHESESKRGDRHGEEQPSASVCSRSTRCIATTPRRRHGVALSFRPHEHAARGFDYLRFLAREVETVTLPSSPRVRPVTAVGVPEGARTVAELKRPRRAEAALPRAPGCARMTFLEFPAVPSPARSGRLARSSARPSTSSWPTLLLSPSTSRRGRR